MKSIFKVIYGLIPFKKYIFSALKLIWTPSEPIFRHLHFKDVFTIKINQSQKFKINHFGLQIENEIFWEGLDNSWEKESLKIWLKLCQNAQTIVDIGANTGIYALIAKTINPKAQVYAFEPHPMFFDMLAKNIKLNHFDIVAIAKAVSDSEGSILIEDYSGKSASITIPSTTLDSFVEKYGLRQIDLIKIDVETHEPEVMAGFAKYLAQFRPTLLIEILNEDVAKKVYQAVQNLGYLYFNIDEKNSIRQTLSLEKSDYYNYLLCSPKIAAKIGLPIKK
ncbi:MAG: FkbM family methyltransferase [Microscillaceae bacterium]|jgi:FkbM family methyltransferase|nr:FkbM family methyltransferase [Microscillaceae bacterium]